jgi:hypothetical protein
MRNVNSFSVKPSEIVSLEVNADRVHLKLASGHTCTWPNRGGLTVVGEKVLTGIQADKDDCETVDGVSIRGSDGGVWSGLTECRVCHAYNKAGTVCVCQEKRDETAKRLEGVKAE